MSQMGPNSEVVRLEWQVLPPATDMHRSERRVGSNLLATFPNWVSADFLQINESSQVLVQRPPPFNRRSVRRGGSPSCKQADLIAAEHHRHHGGMRCEQRFGGWPAVVYEGRQRYSMRDPCQEFGDAIFTGRAEPERGDPRHDLSTVRLFNRAKACPSVPKADIGWRRFYDAASGKHVDPNQNGGCSII
jgi:hypothetical protein